MSDTTDADHRCGTCFGRGNCFADRRGVQAIWFATVEQYVRQLHPEFGFVFKVEHNAIAYWGYSPEAAKAAQLKMLEIVCAHAMKDDLSKGLQIVIEDETWQDRSQTAVAASASVNS